MFRRHDAPAWREWKRIGPSRTEVNDRPWKRFNDEKADHPASIGANNPGTAPHL
jgi:hypothetical protein